MNPTIGVIGNGSWATALVKILTSNDQSVNWYVRNNEYREYIYKNGRNPKYLSSANLNKTKLRVTINIDDLVEASDILLLAVPSAFLHSVLSELTVSLENKTCISAIKGIIPETNTIVAEYLNKQYNVAFSDFALIAGPSHAEEVASEKLTYLTVSSENVHLAKYIKSTLVNNYILVNISHDILGLEYAAVAKNVYAIAAGIYHGMGFGDNFQSVLATNAAREMRSFMEKICRVNADINESAYLGDLLVTMYSQYSRNRTFGTMIGKGYSVKYARMEMVQIAEGYYGAKGLSYFMEKSGIDLPIARSVYEILYEGKSLNPLFSNLSKTMT